MDNTRLDILTDLEKKQIKENLDDRQAVSRLISAALATISGMLGIFFLYGLRIFK